MCLQEKAVRSIGTTAVTFRMDFSCGMRCFLFARSHLKLKTHTALESEPAFLLSPNALRIA